jgi:CRP-like cAMP-binding protein
MSKPGGPALWLTALSDEERRSIEARMLPRRFRRGEVVVAQGDPSTNVYLLDAGHVAVKVATPHGDTITTAVLGPGSGFGEVAQFVEDESRMATVVALDDVAVRILPGRVFAELRARVPAVDTALAQLIAGRLRDISDRFAEITSESVQRRCGRRLVELAEMFGDGRAHGAVIPVTQDDLASLVGASRPTVNQIVGGFAAEGLVSLRRGEIAVPDVPRLRSHVR